MPAPATKTRREPASASRGRPNPLAAPYHHGALHAALLAAAQDILESQGLEGLTLRAAARAAGVSHAAPKNHFDDLTGLLSELAAVGFRQFADALQLAAAGHAVASPERFESIGHAYVAFAREHPAMFLLMFRSERLDMERPALREAIELARQALAGAAAGRLGLSQEAGAPVTPDQSATMVAAWSLVHGFAMLLIDGRLNPVLARRPEGADWQTLLTAVFNSRRAR
ncbi:TetR-like C-terminal domain-containing protein [Variovorax sp. J22P240]|uniref:TetR-like C-terminal domain-containing protein n=1 Tax=Variovorax sp. J22P240 TaxID=3053514 RepID=UPI002576D7E5|nr:TetR-like C-terminal domain-containing protein [Variovorax sp. J22P240]MDM0002848.1 TetR-like C-terminal domain-containing protein [Variovorax sp. J22P240]